MTEKRPNFLTWARQRASPKDLGPLAVGTWLLKSGIESGNEMFVFIALYLYGLIPAWWADDKSPPPVSIPTPSPPGPPEAP